LKSRVSLYLIIFFCLCLSEAASAQSVFKLRGTILDNTKIGVPGANIRLIAGKDTLSSNTDSLGKFSFSGLKSREIRLLVRSVGYLSLDKSFSLKPLAEQELAGLILHATAQQLEEVVIKGKVVPVRLMKDTVEYNAAAYTVRENDNVDELLKQLPGVEVDKDGNVTAEGKAMTKLRVNGKDFFTSNVKDFISRLPAGIVDKLQVIDDYGDKAKFTGVRNAEPQKMLNLVLKNKINGGAFGNAVASAGTNDRYGLNLNGNLWKGDRQIGLNSFANNTNTGAGINNSNNVSANYRNSLGKKYTLSGSYSYGRNKTELSQQSYIETVNSLGTIYNQSDNQSSSNSNQHHFDLGLQSRDEVNFLQASLRGSLASSTSEGINSSMQTGVIRQDLVNASRSAQHSPNINADLNAGRRLKKPGRTITLGITGGTSLSDGSDNQQNRIGYYDLDTELLVKDSLRNQLIDTRNRVTNFNSSLIYTEPLSNPKDSLVKKGIDITYLFALTHTDNKLSTALADTEGSLNRVDSLSNQYSSSFITQTIGINYRYEQKKFNYSLGLTAQPNLLTGAYEGREDKIHRAGFNVSPVARVSYVPSRKHVFGLYYSGNSMAPNFNQLQPVSDTRNLQNVIIGNPNLKASFNHNVNLSYRSVSAASGRTLQVMLRGTVTQDKVVSNTVLIPDTLNSFRQETRFLNTGGNYTLGGNYYWSMPFQKHKYNVEFKGGVNYNRQVSFADNEKNFGKGFNLNQGLSGRMNQKWLMLSSNVNYSYRSNVYSLATANSTAITNWLFDIDLKTFIIKSFAIGVAASKTINQGYSLPGNNPFLINAFLEKTFFKDRRASVKIEGNDLLKQGNVLNRTISDNSITESRSNQVTRYFLFTFNWRLQRFPSGGRG